MARADTRTVRVSYDMFKLIVEQQARTRATSKLQISQTIALEILVGLRTEDGLPRKEKS